MEFEIRTPDIRNEIELIKKYEQLFKQDPEYLGQLYAQMHKTISSIIEKFGDSMLPTAMIRNKFLGDWKDGVITSLVCSWCVGREFAETYSENAKYSLAIENYYSDLLPDATKTELVDLADYGAEIVLRMVHAAYQKEVINEVSTMAGFELINRVHRDSMFFAFKNGVANYYGIKPEAPR